MQRRVFEVLLAVAVASASLGCSSDESPSDPNAAGTGGSGTSEGTGEPGEDGEPTVGIDGEFAPSDRTPRRSAGCGTGAATPAIGQQRLSSGGVENTFIITVPPGYDPNTPNVLAFVFHGANNTEATCRGGGNCIGVQEALEPNAIVVYPKSFGTQWTGPERDQNVTWFDDLSAFVKANYCVDERRVFVLGTSSGAHFTNILACRRGDQLLAAVPGAGERFETENCVGRVAALVIHGVDDTSVPFVKGEEARDAYAALNGCTSMTVPDLAGAHAEVRTARDADMSTHACVDFQGCMAGLPVRWCEHSEPGYDGSTHGFPVFGGAEAWDFVSPL